MKSLFSAFCLFIISLSVNSAEINFLENPTWSTVLEKAKKEKKMIFLDGYATWCGPCKKMDAETYKDQAVADYYNTNFINVKFDMEKGEGLTLAERYKVQAYPNLMFIDGEGTILHKGVGYLEAADFVNLGKDAKNPSAQYFTLKSKALELDNASFTKFAERAVAFEDEDADQIFADYLKKQADILANDDLLSIVMEYISVLPDEKSLTYLKANQAKVIKSGKYTAGDFSERMIGLTLGYALSDEIQTNETEIDFDAMYKVLEKFIPENAFFVGHYFKAQYHMDNKKPDEAVAELNFLIANYPSKVNLDQISNALMNMGPELSKENKFTPVLSKFDAIKIAPSDASIAYMKDFVKAIIYIKNQEMDKFKAKAAEMIANKDVPDNIKDDLKSALERVKSGG